MCRHILACLFVICVANRIAFAFQTESTDSLLANVKSIQDSALPMEERTDKVLQAIDSHADQPELIDALIWVVTSSRDRSLKIGERAANHLIRHHIADPRTLELANRHKRAVLPWVLPMLEALWKSPHLSEADRPKVLYGQALQHRTRSELPATIAELSPSEFHLWTNVYGEDGIRSMQGVDVKKAEASALESFYLLKRDYADTYATKDLTYGTLADRAIFAIENLQIGQEAPDIVGVDLDDVPLKLSDYRGKVVMLSFWGTWCGPCMELVPRERALVDRLDSSKFVLLGINSDIDRSQIKPVIERESITWRSFWCGEKGPLGDIPMQWSITSWPTVIVVDRVGVIRSKFTTHENLEAIIDALVAEIP